MKKITLKMLEKSDVHTLEDKELWFAGFDMDNLDFFENNYPMLCHNVSRIFALLPIDHRTIKKTFFCKREYTIENLSDITNIDTNKIAIIIQYAYETEAKERIYEMMSSHHITEDIVVFWCPNKASNFEMQYRDNYKELPLKNIIVFRSGSEQYVYGHDFEDNSRALFEYMVENGYCNTWKLIWLVENPDSIEFDKWKSVFGVEFISYHWEQSDDIEKRNIYFQNICLAKFIFTTETSRFAYRRRHDQIVVQLWHGCGIKTRLRFESMKDRYDYMTVISRFYGDLHEKEYGLRPNQILVTGYPKDDWLFKKTNISIEDLVDIPKKQHLILWGPTYRKATCGMKKLNEVMLPSETGLPVINTYNALKRLNFILEQEDAALIIKLHPLADETIYNDFHLSNIRFVTNKQLYNWGY